MNNRAYLIESTELRRRNIDTTVSLSNTEFVKLAKEHGEVVNLNLDSELESIVNLRGKFAIRVLYDAELN